MDREAIPYLRYWGMLAVKLALVPVCLAWLIHQLLVTTAIHGSSFRPSLMVGALVVNQVALYLFALRMRQVLAVFDVHLGKVAALRIHLQSMFYFFVLPMTVGLELARFSKLRVAVPDSTATGLASALFVDRLMGALSALVVATALVAFVSFRALPDIAVGQYVFLFGLISLLVVGGLAVWPRCRNAIIKLAANIRGHSGGLILALTFSVVMHSCFCTGVYLAALSLGKSASFADIAFATSVAMLFVVVPASFAGAGPAEVAGTGIFLALGFSLDVAVMLALIPYLARLSGAIQGGVWEVYEGGFLAITGTPRGHEKERE